MLDNETLAMLTKLKVAAKKSGVNVDLVRMSSDRDYAAALLNDLSNNDEPEVVMTVLTLMNKFGIISAPAGKQEHEEPGEEDRYIGRLR